MYDTTFLTDDLPFLIMRRTWQPVALSADVPEGGIAGYRLLDCDVVIARLPDGLIAADSTCPHKGMRLDLGRVEDGLLMCAYHGWRYDRTGACAGIPSLPMPSIKKLKCAHLVTYAVQERYGMIWVQLDFDELACLPDIPEFENGNWTVLHGPPTQFRCGVRREIENYLDMTHFSFAHTSTLGKAADAVVPPMQIDCFDTPTADVPDVEMRAPFPALTTVHEQPAKLQSAHDRRQRCYLPNFTVIRQTWPDGDERLLLHVPSPNNVDHCTVFWILAISPNFNGPEPESQLDFAVRVLDEDRLMCENQRPSEVPINPSRGGWGVLVAPGDVLASTYQRLLRKYLLSRRQQIEHDGSL